MDQVALDRIREVEIADVLPEETTPSLGEPLPNLKTIQPVLISLPETRLTKLDLEWSRELPEFLTPGGTN